MFTTKKVIDQIFSFIENSRKKSKRTDLQGNEIKRTKTDMEDRVDRFKEARNTPIKGQDILGLIDFDCENPDYNSPEPWPSMPVYIYETDREKYPLINLDYEIDISPDWVFIVFPEVTCSFNYERLGFIFHDEAREELEDLELMERDIESLSGRLPSLEKIRSLTRDYEITDKEMKEVRRIMYGFALAIDNHISNHE